MSREHQTTWIAIASFLCGVVCAFTFTGNWHMLASIHFVSRVVGLGIVGYGLLRLASWAYIRLVIAAFPR